MAVDLVRSCAISASLFWGAGGWLAGGVGVVVAVGCWGRAWTAPSAASAPMRTFEMGDIVGDGCVIGVVVRLFVSLNVMVLLWL
jgi:hypothetical protein